MSGLFDSGAGVETADFSGFEDGGGGGGDAVYAETPADAGGYDQLATQGYENDPMAQAQAQGYIGGGGGGAEAMGGYGYDPTQAQMEERMQAQMFDAQMQAQTFSAQMSSQGLQAAASYI